MDNICEWRWVEEHVAQTISVWDASRSLRSNAGQQYSVEEQAQREKAYDEGLRAVEQGIKRAPRGRIERLEVQDQLLKLFARFSAAALDLKEETIKILTDDFLPVGTKLARWARHFDPALSMAEIIQASRNAWTACGLQPLLGAPVGLTPSILGYSLLYPYSDNLLDQEELTTEAKYHFSQRFRSLLRGERIAGMSARECALQALIALVEEEYSRQLFPQVFDSFLAIHQAQENSIRQLRGPSRSDPADLLRVSCGKGGTSVVADACLAYGRLSEEESRFAFEWGVLLQLGDDLQDVRDDMRRGSATLFSRAASLDEPLDKLALQLLNFSEAVGNRMDHLPNGSLILKELLKMSWRSLIIRAVADSHQFFTPAFLKRAECFSPFRFEFLRARQERLVSRHGLYSMLFDAFLEAPESDTRGPTLPCYRLRAPLLSV